MAFLGVRYYVGPLSAASLHGAAHQAPQEVQVVCEQPFRGFLAGRQFVRFIVFKRIDPSHLVAWKTPTGTMAVSTPEATAIGLVRYPQHCGQLGHIVTAEVMNAGRLATVASNEAASAQRLGWLLDHLGTSELADAIHGAIQSQRLWWFPLVPGQPRAGVRRNERRHILENAELAFET